MSEIMNETPVVETPVVDTNDELTEASKSVSSGYDVLAWGYEHPGITLAAAAGVGAFAGIAAFCTVKKISKKLRAKKACGKGCCKVENPEEDK